MDVWIVLERSDIFGDSFQEVAVGEQKEIDTYIQHTYIGYGLQPVFQDESYIEYNTGMAGTQIVAFCKKPLDVQAFLANLGVDKK